MKTSLVAVLLLSWAIHLSGQSTSSVPRLSGIVNLPENKSALFEVANPRFDRPEQFVEVRYAFDTLFGWNGLKIVPAAEGFVKAVPIHDDERVAPEGEKK